MKTVLCGTNSNSAPRSVQKLHLLLAESINMTYVILPSNPKNIRGNLMSEKEKLALIVQWNALVKGAMEKVGLPSDYEHMEKQM